MVGSYGQIHRPEAATLKTESAKPHGSGAILKIQGCACQTPRGAALVKTLKLELSNSPRGVVLVIITSKTGSFELS